MGDDRDGRGSGGGADTRFLDLEISKVIYDEAEQSVREAWRELIKEAAKEKIRERYSEELDAVVALAVDQMSDDLSANLEIEEKIAERSNRSKELDDQIRAAMRAGKS